MKLALPVLTVLSAASLLCAQDVAPVVQVAEGASPVQELTSEDVLKVMTEQLSDLVSLLASVRDEATANETAGKVESLINRLYAVDYAQFEGVDEEEVAAGLTDLFNDLELQVSRLMEEDFYGNAVLKKTFGVEEEMLTPPPGQDELEPGEDEEEPQE